MQNPTNIFIADDHQLFAYSLKSMIEYQTPHRVLKIVANGRQLLHALNEQKPGLLILDINMPELDGEEVLLRVKLLFPGIFVFIVSYIKEFGFIQKVKAAGADGYFIKDEDPDIFLEALQKVLEGEKYFPAKSGLPIIETGARSLSKYEFTDREIEVLKLIKNNFTTQQIASLLFVSENTIKTHRKNICRKLNTSDMKIVYKFAMDNI